MSRKSLAGAVSSAVLAVLAGLLAVLLPGGVRAQEAGPDLGIGAKEYPDADAIVLALHQELTLEADGTVRRRERRLTKLLSSRPIRRLADPRIDFREGRDEVLIHAARTHLPDGTVIPVPEYSVNIAAPDDVEGWPAFAEWRQRIVSFSGLRDGAVIELDFEVVTPPGDVPWISEDLRLTDDDPTVARTVVLTVPEGTPVRHRLTGLPEGGGEHVVRTADSVTTHRWTFSRLRAAPGEPQSPPWQSRCGRLMLSTCRDAALWTDRIGGAAEAAANPDESIRRFAEAAADGAEDAGERGERIARRLEASFHLLDSEKTWHPVRVANAPAVLERNYGSPLELGALLSAALRALGHETSLAVAVKADVWDESVPTDSAFAGLVVRVETEAGPVLVHPRRGVIRDPGTWGRFLLLDLDSEGRLRTARIRLRGEAEPSRIALSGRLALRGPTEGGGTLSVELTGAFFDPAKLEGAEAQRKLLSAVAGRLVAGAGVTEHTITHLTDVKLRADKRLDLGKAIRKQGEARVLTLGQGPLFLPDFPMPLARSRRDTDVALRGPFVETVDLTLEIPAGWGFLAHPGPLAKVAGEWGEIEQTVGAEGNVLRIARRIEIRTAKLGPSEFEAVRRAVNLLRAEGSRLVVAAP